MPSSKTGGGGFGPGPGGCGLLPPRVRGKTMARVSAITASVPIIPHLRYFLFFSSLHFPSPPASSSATVVLF